MWDDTNAYLGAYNKFKGFSNDRPFDLSDQGAWDEVIWKRNIKIWHDTVPQNLWFKINGRPVIALWSLGDAIFSNQEGNASQLLTFLSGKFNTTYGVHPLFIVDISWIEEDTTIQASQVYGVNKWFNPPQDIYTYWDNYGKNEKIGVVVPSFRDPNTPPMCGSSCRERTRNDGNTLRDGLQEGYNQRAKFVLLEGWTDIAESAGFYRSKSWQFPNQYINIVREFADRRTKTLRLEAESCDSFSDTTPGNTGGYFRDDEGPAGFGLDVGFLTGSEGNGWYVGWTAQGEWIEFKDLPLSEGTYLFSARASSGSPGKTIRLEVDGVSLGSVAVPYGGGFSAYDTFSLGSKFVTHGKHTLRIVFEQDLINLDWVFVKKVDQAVGFKTANNHYIVAESGGGEAMYANRSALGSWETFTLIDVNGGTLQSEDRIRLQAHNGYYVVAEAADPNNNYLVNANRLAPFAWEEFTIVKLNGGGAIVNGDQVAIRTAHNRYFAAAGGSGENLKANCLTIGACGGEESFTFTQAGASCSYSINLAGQAFSANGGMGSVNVITNPGGCSWTASSNAPWITINSGGSGTGGGTVNYSVAANSDTTRTGTVTIAGQTFTVSQTGASCSYGISPPMSSLFSNVNHSIAACGGTGVVHVTADAGCQWTASSNVPWITIISGGSGSGNGVVKYSVAPGANFTRADTMTVAGQTFTVRQVCDYPINPVSQSFPASGGTGSVNVTANLGSCLWTATSNVSWITINSGGSGSGSGSVNYSVAANAGVARNGIITIADRTFTVSQSADFAGLMYYPLSSPVRLLDTRPGESGCFTPGTPLAAGNTITQPTRNNCGIPANAKAVVGNATVVNFISDGGHITLYPSDAALPNASNLNFTANHIVPNSFTVGLGSDGAFKIYSYASTHFIVDISGYYAPPGPGGLYYHPLSAPVRLFDSRPGEIACDAPGVPLANDGTRTVLAHRICSGATIPSTAKAIAGNATVVNFISTGFHWITLYPFGVTQPTVSNLNFAQNQIVPNWFVVGLSSDGKFNIYSHAATHFIVDVAGYFSEEQVDANGAGLLYNALPAPVRLLDTRPGEAGCEAPGAPLGNDATRTQSSHHTCFGVRIPTTAKTVVGNATVVNFISTGFHWITLYPFGVPQPTASNLNFTQNQIVPNAFWVGLSGDGKFNIYSHASTHFIVDLTGYFAP
jgi:hypothetical protein